MRIQHHLRLRPLRWAIVMALMAMTCIAYIDRVAISFALIPAAKDFHLSTVEQGVILSAFSWGYVAAMIPGGWLADRSGPIRILGWSSIGWAFASLASALSVGFAPFVAGRFALGAAEAPSFPAAAGLIAEEFSPERRGLATALFDGGSYIGLIIGGPIVGFTVVVFGWRFGLGLCAAISLVWLGVFLLASRTRTDPRQKANHQNPLQDKSLAERCIFLARQRSVIFISCGFFCYNYVKSFFLTWFPIFLVKDLGFSQKTSSLLTAIPPMGALLASVCVGLLTDHLIQAGGHPARMRRRFIVAGLTGTAIIGLAPQISNPLEAVFILAAAFSALISTSPGIWALPADIAPSTSWVSTVGGAQNSVSNVAGIVAPIVTGVTLQSSGGSYIIALLITSGISIVGAIMYLTSGPLEPLAWPRDAG